MWTTTVIAIFLIVPDSLFHLLQTSGSSLFIFILFISSSTAYFHVLFSLPLGIARYSHKIHTHLLSSFCSILICFNTATVSCSPNLSQCNRCYHTICVGLRSTNAWNINTRHIISACDTTNSSFPCHRLSLPHRNLFYSHRILAVTAASPLPSMLEHKGDANPYKD